MSGYWHRMMYKCTIFFVFATAIFFCVSCTAGGSNVVVSADAKVPLEVVKNVEESVALTRRFFSEQYAVILNRPVQFVLVADKEQYHAALIEKQGLSLPDANNKASHSVANSREHIIIINAEALRAPRYRYYIPAHELTHQYQYQLMASSNVTSFKWMFEGFANVTAANVTEIAGKSRMADDKRVAIEILKHKQQRPRLSELSTRSDWEHSLKTYGSDAAYTTSDVAVLFLISLYDREHIISFFKATQKNDAGKVFWDTFGITIESFEDRFEAYLQEEFSKTRHEFR